MAGRNEKMGLSTYSFAVSLSLLTSLCLPLFALHQQTDCYKFEASSCQLFSEGALDFLSYPEARISPGRTSIPRAVPCCVGHLQNVISDMRSNRDSTELANMPW